MNAVLLPLRLSIFVFIVLAVIYAIRNRVPNDRRLVGALLAGAGVALAAVLSLILDAVVAGDKQTIVRFFVMLPGAMGLAVGIWVASYAGMVLWGKSGGYWFRNNSAGRWVATSTVGVLVVLGLLLWSSLVCRLFAVPVAPVSWNSPVLLLSYVSTQLAYSLGEEFFYRGWVQGVLGVYLAKFRWGSGAAIALAAVVFAVQHVGGPYQLPILIIAVGGGLTFGVVFQRFGLVTAAGVHLLANLVQALVLPYLVK